MNYRIFLGLLFDVRLLHGMSLSADPLQRQSETRAGRERAVRGFNSIASELGVPQLASRPSPSDVAMFWLAVRHGRKD